MFPIRVKTVQESDLRMLGSLARNIQRVLPVTQADIDAAAALGKGWVVWKVFEVSDPLDNLRGGTQLIIRQNSVQPGQNVRRVIFVSGPGGQTVVIRGTDYIVLPDAIANSLSYVKAFGGTEQQNIPQPYTQVNYVTNTVRTAVDTGIMIDFAKNYEFEVECRAVSGSWYILQSRASSAGNITGISGANSGSTIILAVGNVTACTSAITRTVGNKLYVKATLNAGIATLYVKDETAGTEDTQTGSYGPTQPNPTAAVYLLGNAGGNYVDVNSDIYMVRIKENGVTVMDYVPARQVATAGFYDTVSGTFKTALTPANLSADGETVPTPDAPMDIVSNNGALEFQDSELPSEYRRLLGYACDNDVLWQITDFHLRGSDTVRISFSVTAACNVFGCYQGVDATDNYDLYVSTSSGGRYLRYGDGTYLSYWSSANLGQKFDVVFTPTGTTGMPQDSTWTPLTFESANDFLVGSTTLTGSSSKLKGNLYGDIIVDGRLKLIPCERISDSVLGYYDTYTGTFYEPTGTPTSLGYDFSYYSIKTSGTVETIQIIGKNKFDKNNLTRITAYIPFTGGNWTYTASGYSVRIPCQPNTTYTARYNGNSTQTVLSFASTSSDDVPTSGSPVSTANSIRQGSPTINTPITITTGASDKWLIVAYNAANPENTDMADNLQIEIGSTATDYQPYHSNTATAEMLLKVGDYQDKQEIISGAVTRNVGVKVLDGTEGWVDIDGRHTCLAGVENILPSSAGGLCNYLPVFDPNNPSSNYIVWSSNLIEIGIPGTSIADLTTWLADQYAAGTPVIMIYPLATPTTESVAGQALQVTDGDNVLEITQASLTGLELEAQYNAAVSLTIQEVEDANLDNNVTVTIQ